jgi:hypothetical protein
MVTSTIGMLPWQTASVAINASVADEVRTTGTTPGYAIADRFLPYCTHSSLPPFSYRAMRAPTPSITCRTSFIVAMLVSPGVVMASAPCAAPHSTAHCGS